MWEFGGQGWKRVVRRTDSKSSMHCPPRRSGQLLLLHNSYSILAAINPLPLQFIQKFCSSGLRLTYGLVLGNVQVGITITKDGIGKAEQKQQMKHQSCKNKIKAVLLGWAIHENGEFFFKQCIAFVKILSIMQKIGQMTKDKRKKIDGRMDPINDTDSGIIRQGLLNNCN